MNRLTKKITLLKVILFALLLLTSLNLLAQLPGKIHLGFIYPLSTNGTHAPLDTNTLSIHLLAGVSAAERGLTFAGFSNFIRKDAIGSQFAGFSNHIGGKADGAQFAGFVNTYGGGKGAAFAGFANIAHGEVRGVQFAGFINIANTVKGAQFAGFINIADSSDYPIGIINLIKNGEKSIGVSTDETQTTMLSFRSGGKTLYGIIGIGYNFKNSDEVYAAELGLGAHFFTSNAFNLNTEVVATTLESFNPGDYFKSTFRLMPNVKLFKTLGIFGGPSFNFVTTNTNEGKQLYTKNLRNWDNKWGNNYNAIYLGYTLGLHILF